jgi:hypothetical protein
MRLKNLLDRKIIAVIFLLGVILISIKDPIPDISKITELRLNLNKSVSYQCLAGDLPETESIIFFENPYNPAANTNTIALYYRAQFFLAPRLLHLKSITDQTIESGETRWFIGAKLEPEQAEQLRDTYQLSLVKVCGPFSLFHKD